LSSVLGAAAIEPKGNGHRVPLAVHEAPHAFMRTDASGLNH